MKTRQALILGAAIALPLVGEGAAVADETAPNVIEFETQNRNDAGTVRCGLFKQAGWLKEPFRTSAVKIEKSLARCIFKDVPAGTYGISAFHDENDDGKIGLNLMGFPVEEYCASNNARSLLSAPRWKDARFTHVGASLRLRAVMK
jgi:uncharacterized protein (DUF2141 family)